MRERKKSYNVQEIHRLAKSRTPLSVMAAVLNITPTYASEVLRAEGLGHLYQATRECACGCGKTFEVTLRNYFKRFTFSNACAERCRRQRDLLETKARFGWEQPVCANEGCNKRVPWSRLTRDAMRRRVKPTCSRKCAGRVARQAERFKCFEGPHGNASKRVRQTYCFQKTGLCVRYQETIGQGCYTGSCYIAPPPYEYDLYRSPMGSVVGFASGTNLAP
jgi:hypothetical protein